MTEVRNATPFSRFVPPPRNIAPQAVARPAQKPPATAKNHPPARGHPVPPMKAAPVPMLRKQPPLAAGNGAAAGGRESAPPAPPAPPPTRGWGKHVLRGPEEYPAHLMQNERFHIGREEYPQGFDLQWIAVSVWQQPQPSTEAGFLQMGWKPVETGEFDGLYDGRFTPRSQAGPMIVEGLMLCARPMSWSVKSREILQRDAESQVRLKVRQLAQGDLSKVTMDAQHKHLDKTNYVKVSMEGVHVPVSPE